MLLEWTKYSAYASPADPGFGFSRDGYTDDFDYDDFVDGFDNSVCPGGTAADANFDGSVDDFDYDDFGEAFEQENRPDWLTAKLDYARDGFIDGFDYDEFINYTEHPGYSTTSWWPGYINEDPLTAMGARLLFAGYWWDPKVQLYHVRNRDYILFLLVDRAGLQIRISGLEQPVWYCRGEAQMPQTSLATSKKND